MLLVGVLLADRGVDLDLLLRARTPASPALMLDTADKKRGALPDVAASRLRCRNFVAARRRPACLPGSRDRCAPSMLPLLLSSAPDVLGFRGGLCSVPREPPPSILTPCAPCAAPLRWPRAPSVVLRRLQTERGMSDKNIGKLAGQTWLDGVTRDRIFVRGLVLPVAIGVYDEEQGVTQKVRFTVEASVATGVSPKGDDSPRCRPMTTSSAL